MPALPVLVPMMAVAMFMPATFLFPLAEDHRNGHRQQRHGDNCPTAQWHRRRRVRRSDFDIELMRKVGRFRTVTQSEIQTRGDAVDRETARWRAAPVRISGPRHSP